MNIKDYIGKLVFKRPVIGDYEYKRVLMKVLTPGSGIKQIMFDFGDSHTAYRVKAVEIPSGWQCSFQYTGYGRYRERSTIRSLDWKGYLVEGLRVEQQDKGIVLKGTWVEDGRSYPVEYSGVLESDRDTEDDLL
jgi:hypothetical protein